MFLSVTGNPSSFGNPQDIDSILKAALAATKNPDNNAHTRTNEEASKQIEIYSNALARNMYGLAEGKSMSLQAQPTTPEGSLPEQRKRPASTMCGHSNSNNCGLPLIIQPKKSRTSSSSSSATQTDQASPVIYGFDEGEDDGIGGSPPPKPAILLSNQRMYTVPGIDELNDHVEKTGNYVFINLEIGHRDHGSVMFLGFRDLKSLAGGNTINLSDHVNFRHGGIEFPSQTGCLHIGPKLLSLFRITRVEFGKQFGIEGEERPTDHELKEILTTLTKRMNAAFSQYNEQQGIWLFMTFPPGGNGDDNGNNGNS